MQNISPDADIIDVRDVIERVEQLEADPDDDAAEFDMLNALLDELRGNGEDHQWRGDWYPVTLIRDTYFTEYAKDLADDLGVMNHSRLGETWPLYCIDWERAARDLQMDYTSVEYCGVTYWYR